MKRTTAATKAPSLSAIEQREPTYQRPLTTDPSGKMPKASASPPPRLIGPCWRMARPLPPPLPFTPKPRLTRDTATHNSRGVCLSPSVLPAGQTNPGPTTLVTVSRPTSKTFPPPSLRSEDVPDGQPLDLIPQLQRDSSSSHRRCGHETTALALETRNAKLVTEAQGLRDHVQRLERALQRSKTRLQQKSEQVKDGMAILEETRTQLVMAEEKVEEMENLACVLSKDLNQFRSWWLTEYLSLRALLELVPEKADVEPLMSSAEARFKVYTSTS